MKKTLKEFCEENGQSQLLEQWDTPRNLPLTPDLVTYGSKRKVWWRCKQGHTWQASICTRTGNGTGCPVCAGKMPVAGENDLQSRYPELAREWHPHATKSRHSRCFRAVIKRFGGCASVDTSGKRRLNRGLWAADVRFVPIVW